VEKANLATKEPKTFGSAAPRNLRSKFKKKHEEITLEDLHE